MGTTDSNPKGQPKKIIPLRSKLSKTVVQAVFEKKITSKESRSHYWDIFQRCLSDKIFDRALGCLFGSFIGDSLGSYCQFSKNISENVIDKAMNMPGGGVFSLKPGQFTDDSQLSAHLLRGLHSKLQNDKTIQQQHYTLIQYIAKEYVKWIQSRPFDIGNTCKKGIKVIKRYESQLQNKNEDELKELFSKIFKDIHEANKQSQSNGSLMRITPLAVLFSCGEADPTQHQQFIKDQIRLMHSNQTVQQAGYLWVNMLTQVILRKSDDPSQIALIYEQNKRLDSRDLLKTWFEEAESEQRMPANVSIGWAKIAWSYGMNQLLQLSKQKKQLKSFFYISTIKKMISKGGDTDTNAAIVGGLLGSLIGFTNLPGQYLQPMLSLIFPQQNEAVTNSQKRPHCYEPFYVLLDSLSFIEKCRDQKRRIK